MTGLDRKPVSRENEVLLRERVVKEETVSDVRDFICGFKSFQEEYFRGGRKLFDSLQTGQNPKALVVACCDSRTDPFPLMRCDPGDIFVVRNIANIAPPYQPDESYHGVSAAVEYAVTALEVPDIIILGHSSCGGIHSLIEGKDSDTSQFVGKWISILKPARERALSEFGPDDPRVYPACEMAGILTSMENLLTFPFVAERVKQGKLRIHGWYFDMKAGALLSYLPQTGDFEELVPLCPLPESQG
jgi:carbonic anhydrase